MAIKQIKIDVNEVTAGMFVSGLDRPWTQTPFPLQGFYVKDLEEIKQLKAHCRHVYIDVIKGSSPLKAKATSASAAPKPKVRERRAPAHTKVTDVPPIKVRHNAYPTPAPLAEEMSNAKTLHQQVKTAVTDVMDQIHAGQTKISLLDASRAASAMVGSVLRSPDAFTWLTRVKEKDSYTYNHAIRCAVWAILFGRHIGVPKNDLDVLVLGVLLKDTGKTKLEAELIEKQDRTPEEQSEYEHFVDYGVNILRKIDGISPRIVSVVKTHCERINGSGFPQHLRGDSIPLLGKIAAIVTFYDETTNPRGQKNPLAPSKTVAKLYESRGVEFQADLVVEFIRAIGLYPTGTLVELNTGEVAVVVEQNFERRLKPKVMIVTDELKNKLVEPKFLDMMADERAKQAKNNNGKGAGVSSVEIAQDLEPSSHDIDINAIRESYLNKSEPKGFLKFLKKRSLSEMFG